MAKMTRWVGGLEGGGGESGHRRVGGQCIYSRRGGEIERCKPTLILIHIIILDTYGTLTYQKKAHSSPSSSSSLSCAVSVTSIMATMTSIRMIKSIATWNARW